MKDQFVDTECRNADQQKSQPHFAERKKGDAMLPLAQMVDTEQAADIQQNQGEGEIAEDAQFSQYLGGQKGRPADQVGKGRTNDQSGQQITGHARDMEARSKTSPDQGAEEDGRKASQMNDGSGRHGALDSRGKYIRSKATIKHRYAKAEAGKKGRYKRSRPFLKTLCFKGEKSPDKFSTGQKPDT